MQKSKLFYGIAIVGIALLIWQMVSIVKVPSLSILFLSREFDSELSISLLGIILLFAGAYFGKKASDEGE